MTFEGDVPKHLESMQKAKSDGWANPWFSAVQKSLVHIRDAGKYPFAQIYKECKSPYWDEEEILSHRGRTFQGTLQVLMDKMDSGMKQTFINY